MRATTLSSVFFAVSGFLLPRATLAEDGKYSCTYGEAAPAVCGDVIDLLDLMDDKPDFYDTCIDDSKANWKTVICNTKNKAAIWIQSYEKDNLCVKGKTVAEYARKLEQNCFYDNKGCILLSGSLEGWIQLGDKQHWVEIGHSADCTF